MIEMSSFDSEGVMEVSIVHRVRFFGGLEGMMMYPNMKVDMSTKVIRAPGW
jgi:hypothetical protein